MLAAQFGSADYAIVGMCFALTFAVGYARDAGDQSTLGRGVPDDTLVSDGWLLEHRCGYHVPPDLHQVLVGGLR